MHSSASSNSRYGAALLGFLSTKKPAMLGLVQRRGSEEIAAAGLRHIFPCEYAAEKRLVSAPLDAIFLNFMNELQNIFKTPEELEKYILSKKVLCNYLNTGIKELNSKLPEKITHYSNALIDIINNEEFWASNCLFMKDTNEIKCFWEIFLTIAKNYKKEKILSFIENKNLFILNNLYESRLFDYFVISFSLTENSKRLWTEYTNNTGCNFTFKANNFINSVRKNNVFITKEIDIIYEKVIYDNNQKTYIIKKYFDNFIKISKKYTNEKYYLALYLLFIEKMRFLAVIFKNKSYCFENEFRLVFQIEKFSNIIKIRNKDNKKIPYIPIKFTFDNIECLNFKYFSNYNNEKLLKENKKIIKINNLEKI